MVRSRLAADAFSVAYVVPARALTALWHSHASFLPHVLDPLNYLQLVAKRHAHLLQVLILQFEDGLEVLDAVFEELVCILLELDSLQETLHFTRLLFFAILLAQSSLQVLGDLGCAADRGLASARHVGRAERSRGLCTLTRRSFCARPASVGDHACRRQVRLLRLVAREHCIRVALDVLLGRGSAPYLAVALSTGLSATLVLLELHHFLD